MNTPDEKIKSNYANLHISLMAFYLSSDDTGGSDLSPNSNIIDEMQNPVTSWILQLSKDDKQTQQPDQHRQLPVESHFSGHRISPWGHHSQIIC